MMEQVRYVEGATVVVRAGFFYVEEASLRPRVQHITWQVGPSELDDLLVCVVTSRGKDHAQIHMSYADAAALAVALMKARSGRDE